MVVVVPPVVVVVVVVVAPHSPFVEPSGQQQQHPGRQSMIKVSPFTQQVTFPSEQLSGQGGS